MLDTPSDSIWIVTDDTPQISTSNGVKSGTTTTRSWSEEPPKDTRKRVGDAVQVSTQKLEQEMTHFLQVVGRLFNRAEQQAKVNSGMQLDQIELSVEISGEGEVKLIGNGAKAGGKGAIKLTFKRQEPK
ncbi:MULTISPECIES: hypothetical protein [unclassified Nodularia (in: cyanobacteria)]|uniref:Pepco domain-containing protein n=1 Tax=unclassified Nodularia (in: cyanobacteria) TaxID=2656917 RepID=UPI00187FA9E9|nr:MULTISPECIES: hypothetical protein [unclassified Nodularia (in: cyanobacteria)]MBE9201996.1 hypothetical protein [Nodularia sp. LEGE 06071]MCC2694282.1 hypothetical protein [Nodularia sp. LEGE 04288]